MEFDADGCAMKEIQELIERFESLQKNITEKREFFHRVTGKWHKFAEQKHKMNSFFKNTQGIVTKRQVKNADDCKKQIEECKVTALANVGGGAEGVVAFSFVWDFFKSI